MAGKKRSGLVLRNGSMDPFWDPFNMLGNMDRLMGLFENDFDRGFYGGSPLVFRHPPAMRRYAHRMPMDVADKGDHYEVMVELPGIRKDDVKLSLEDGVLSVGIESKEEKSEEDEGRYVHRERSDYRCSRCIRLPDEVDPEKVTASMEDGILNIALEKRHPEPVPETREIPIE